MSETSETNKQEVKMGICGRRDITIPVEYLTKDNLAQYLSTIIGTFNENQANIIYLDNIYKGFQDIYNKEKEVRPTINNKVVENHAFEMVEFLKGYMYGKPVKYAQISENKLIDDIEQLNTYMIDKNKASLDSTIMEWLGKVGVAYYMCLPKGYEHYTLDIISSLINRRKIYKPKFNLDKEAPFNLYLLDPKCTFTIKSSWIGNEEIGAGVITKVSDTEYMLTIYAPHKKFTIPLTSSYALKEEIIEEETAIPYIPIVEYKLNASKIGIIEIVKDMLDLLNRITSNQIDDIEQFVNAVMVFTNQKIDKEEFEELLKLGAINIKSINPSFPADVKLLQQTLKQTDVNSYYERIYNKMMGIVAIPKQSDQAKSGGDTQGARLLGEGWTLADQRALSYQNIITESERKLLTIMLYICRNTDSCKINELYPSDVEVKFSRSKSDNMLVKSQVIMNLKTAGLPEEIIANVCELFDAPLEVAQSWKENLELKKQEQLEFANKSFNNNDNMETDKKDTTVNNQDNRTKNIDLNKESVNNKK